MWSELSSFYAGHLGAEEVMHLPNHTEEQARLGSFLQSTHRACS